MGRDHGSATLTTVVLAPVAILIATAAFQLALWTHARTEARSIARDSAVLAARAGADDQAVDASATQLLVDEVGLVDVAVEVARDATTVVVTVQGSAPGMFHFTERPIEVREAVPIEDFRDAP